MTDLADLAAAGADVFKGEAERLRNENRRLRAEWQEMNTHALAQTKFLNEFLDGLAPLLPRGTQRNVKGIVAAVAELKARVAELEADKLRFAAQGEDQGRQDERRAIAAWLRRGAGAFRMERNTAEADEWDAFAGMIEQGAHLKGGS